MQTPITNGTTSGIYRPPSMTPTRPGAQDHRRYASLLTGNTPPKPDVIYTAPETNISPKPIIMTTAKKIPAKAIKPAAKRAASTEDYSTTYKPEPVIVVVPEPPKVLGQKRKSRDAYKPATYVDVDSLVICADTPVFKRFQTASKYEAFFDSMKPGQCVKCLPEQAGQVSGALESYLKRNGISARVKSTCNYPADGMGRVWWLDKKAP